MGGMLTRRNSNRSSRRKDGKWRSSSHSTCQKNQKERNHHTKGKHHHQNQKDNPKRSSRDLSNVKCYTCDEKGHFSIDCPRNKGGSHKKKDNKRRHHAHTAEDDEPPRKRVKEESEDSSSDEEYVLISALIGTVITRLVVAPMRWI